MSSAPISWSQLAGSGNVPPIRDGPPARNSPRSQTWPVEKRFEKFLLWFGLDPKGMEKEGKDILKLRISRLLSTRRMVWDDQIIAPLHILNSAVVDPGLVSGLPYPVSTTYLKNRNAVSAPGASLSMDSGSAGFPGAQQAGRQNVVSFRDVRGFASPGGAMRPNATPNMAVINRTELKVAGHSSVLYTNWFGSMAFFQSRTVHPQTIEENWLVLALIVDWTFKCTDDVVRRAYRPGMVHGLGFFDPYTGAPLLDLDISNAEPDMIRPEDEAGSNINLQNPVDGDLQAIRRTDTRDSNSTGKEALPYQMSLPPAAVLDSPFKAQKLEARKETVKFMGRWLGGSGWNNELEEIHQHLLWFGWPPGLEDPRLEENREGGNADVTACNCAEVNSQALLASRGYHCRDNRPDETPTDVLFFSCDARPLYNVIRTQPHRNLTDLQDFVEAIRSQAAVPLCLMCILVLSRIRELYQSELPNYEYWEWSRERKEWVRLPYLPLPKLRQYVRDNKKKIWEGKLAEIPKATWKGMHRNRQAPSQAGTTSAFARSPSSWGPSSQQGAGGQVSQSASASGSWQGARAAYTSAGSGDSRWTAGSEGKGKNK